jgi:hypothetical protein
MIHRIDKVTLDRRVQDVVQYLRDNIVIDRQRSPAWAGWHNLSREGRIGTTGTALPVLFLRAVGQPIPERDAVLTALRESQTPDDEGAGWTILSLSGSRPNVEGTTWPLRALSLAGDREDAQRVQEADLWLTSQQNEDGGWGSTKGSDSRLTLTTSAISALILGGVRNREALDAAQDWLVRTQRSGDGSWGPTHGESGTAHHTCLAIMSLLELGARRIDQALLVAREFVLDAWKPRPQTIQTEVYDAHDPHLPDHYRKVILEHDVDALVCQALLRLGQPGDITTVVGGAQRLLEIPYDALQVDQVSLWNVLPRAFLAHELRELPMFGGGHVIARKGAAASVEGSKRRHGAGALAALALSELPLTPATFKRGALVLAVLVVLALVALWLLGELSLAGFLGSAILPVLLAAYALLPKRRDE